MDEDPIDDQDDTEAGAGAPWAQEGEARQVAVSAQAAGERIDTLLARAWPDLSRARIQGLIGEGRLRADGAPARLASAKARAGVVYTLSLPPPAPPTPQAEDLPLSVVFEDAHLIVIDKAAGMAMHPAAGSPNRTLVNALLHHCAGSLSGIGGVARPGIVHRIDKDTTGLVVVAKHDEAHRSLARQFAKHTVERAYFAIARGAPTPRNGRIESQLVRSGEDRRKFVTTSGAAGKRAVTHYWTVETFGRVEGEALGRAAAAFLECRLETGRTHQIRAHVASLGCPLIGDPLYGKFRGLKAAGAGPIVEAAKEAARDFPRQALHAGVLGFTHPVTEAQMRFASPLPADLEALAAALRRLPV